MLAGHHEVTAAVSFARYDSHFRDCGLGVCIEQLRAMTNDAFIFLSRARQKSRNVDKSHHGNIEAIAKSNEAGGLDRGIDVQTSRQTGRLIGHDTYRAAA